MKAAYRVQVYVMVVATKRLKKVMMDKKTRERERERPSKRMNKSKLSQKWLKIQGKVPLCHFKRV